MYRRFWIEFEETEHGPSWGLGYGCGVTGRDRDDAIDIVERALAKMEIVATIRNITDDVDVSTLDEGHVIPNMGNIFPRGIWFPNRFGE